jgi:hypothetical protein
MGAAGCWFRDRRSGLAENSPAPGPAKEQNDVSDFVRFDETALGQAIKSAQ